MFRENDTIVKYLRFQYHILLNTRTIVQLFNKITRSTNKKN